MLRRKTLCWTLISVYFAISWFFPWAIINLDSSISPSYFWDIIFVIMTSLILKKYPSMHWHKAFPIRLLIIGFMASSAVILANILNLISPFSYVENIFWQLLILAPVLEELVFRHSIYIILENLFKSEKKQLIFGSLLFSVSHAPALWHLPSTFHPFIVYQLLYTFILGWVLIKSRQRSLSVFEPIFLHFIFNAIFYLAVYKKLI